MLISVHIQHVPEDRKPYPMITPSDLTIACVGSVFKSWDLLREGFMSTVGSGPGAVLPSAISLVYVGDAACGAALLGAETAGLPSPPVDRSAFLTALPVLESRPHNKPKGGDGVSGLLMFAAGAAVGAAAAVLALRKRSD